MDPILSLQTEMIAGLNAQFANLGRDMVLQGCAVTSNGTNAQIQGQIFGNQSGTVNIASGIMYVSGQVVRFDGATGIAADGSQAIVLGSAVDSNPLVFGNQNTYNLYTEQKAVIVAQDPNNKTQMKVTTSALYSFQQYMADQVNASVIAQINSSVATLINNSIQTIVNNSFPKGSIREVYDLDGTFTQNFDSSGKGKVAPWVGWYLDISAYNNGTPGSDGRATIGAGTFNDSVGNRNLVIGSGTLLGEASHILANNEMPTHTHSSLVLGTNNSLTTSSGGHAVPSLDTTPGAIQTGSAGLGQAHNNMQPSIGVYRVVKMV
jgi:hypothetical protein